MIIPNPIVNHIVDGGGGEGEGGTSNRTSYLLSEISVGGREANQGVHLVLMRCGGGESQPIRKRTRCWWDVVGVNFTPVRHVAAESGGVTRSVKGSMTTHRLTVRRRESRREHQLCRQLCLLYTSPSPRD